MSNDETVKSALIIGASRGLGLGLSRELLGRGWHVTATVRAVKSSTGLEDFHEQVTMDALDINDLKMVNAFVDRARAQVFDVVFINAGIAGPEGKTAETVTAEEIAHVFMTNAVSPLRLAEKLAPCVRPQTGILAFMTSLLGSVEIGQAGFAPFYCASKAALNRLTRGFAGAPGQNITVINMHPGWVRTDMGGPNADIDVATSCEGMADVLAAQAGAGGQQFLDYQGKTLPW